jgi:hypothetical protein
MSNRISEVVKEYVLDVDELNFSVKGRVTKTIRADGLDEFYWNISHHYRPSETAGGVYYPSRIRTDTLEEAERLLLLYMSGFTTIDVTPNMDY